MGVFWPLLARVFLVDIRGNLPLLDLASHGLVLVDGEIRNLLAFALKVNDLLWWFRELTQ